MDFQVSISFKLNNIHPTENRRGEEDIRTSGSNTTLQLIIRCGKTK